MAIVVNEYDPGVGFNSCYNQPGYYFVGLTQRLVMFPTNEIIMEFKSAEMVTSTSSPAPAEGAQGPTLACWSSEGVNVYIDMTLYYKLHKDYIVDMYKEFGGEWKDYL